MTGAHFRWPIKVYIPRAWPISATPAAEPIDNRLPPTPAVNVINNQLPMDMSGLMVNTANMIGILSITADSTPRKIFTDAALQPRSEERRGGQRRGAERDTGGGMGA